ncbi:conserved protein of unknown function [Rhodovastum atsumiense]|nr:DUF1186 domain-containing protein [Rhodovastum atsumiense]CAH2603731.1 conserved protein of unknown function [Rhodovastum atsumiense]
MTEAVLTDDAILEAFATAENALPREALRQAAERWPGIAPALLAPLEAAAAGTDRSDRNADIVFYAVYLMAQARDTRAFRPLCALGADPELLDRILGDGITMDLPAILARVFDGDPAPLHALVRNNEADEYARDAALEALAWLTATGRIDRDETAAFLRDLFTTLPPQKAEAVWVGWQQAIAALALEGLVPLVEQAFARNLIDPSFLALSDFREDLRKAQQPGAPADAILSRMKDLSSLDDAVEHLSRWDSFQPKPAREERWTPDLLPPTEPVRNPLRDVGRNDPCPCGSGKKFKKCCLGRLG